MRYRDEIDDNAESIAWTLAASHVAERNQDTLFDKIIRYIENPARRATQPGWLITLRLE